MANSSMSSSYPPDPEMDMPSPLPVTNTYRLEQIVASIDRDRPMTVAQVRDLHTRLADLLDSLRET